MKLPGLSSVREEWEFESAQACDKGLQLDLKYFTSFTYDNITHKIKVGPAIQVGDLFNKMWNAGERALSFGNCPTIGIGGHVLGGGMGFFMRQYGYVSESLTELEMVTGRGKVVRALQSLHADLLWASQGGGGGQFGVVTSLTLRTLPGHTVVTVLLTYCTKHACIWPFINWWQTTAWESPFASGGIGYEPETGFAYLNMILHGGKIEAIKKLNDMKLWPITRRFSQKVLLLEMTELEGFFLTSGLKAIAHSPKDFERTVEKITNNIQTYEREISKLDYSGSKVKSGYTSKLITNEMIEKTIDISKKISVQQPWFLRGSIMYEFYGGPGLTNASGPMEGVHKSLTNIKIESLVDPSKAPEGNADLLEWVNSTYSIYEPIIKGVYVNYPDGDIQNYMEAYYGKNSKKMSQIKKRYDPENVFRFPLSIPLPSE